MTPKKILIIDDDKVIATIYQNKLRLVGYECEVVDDGAKVPEMLETTLVDLVILDLSLPGINGLELLKLIRSRPDTQQLPVLILSNVHLTNIIQDAWNAGATNCLSKASCTPNEMVNIVANVLATGPDGKISFDLPAAPRLPGLPGVSEEVFPAQSDREFQNKVVAAFLTSAPKAIIALREGLRVLDNPERETVRPADMYEVYRLTRSLASEGGVAGFRIIAQLASALEALLKGLHDKPEGITPSTIRTISQAVDKLALLVSSAGSLTGHSTAPESPLILVVDDELVSRDMIFRGLVKAGLRALSMDNSILALQVLEQNRFDLIFLDISMPAPNGIEVCEQLRKMPLNRLTPVVFVTANSDFESKKQTILSGGDDFIGKPFLLLELAVKALTLLYNEDLSWDTRANTLRSSSSWRGVVWPSTSPWWKRPDNDARAA